MGLRYVTIKFDKNGLVPMVIQDANTGAVLSLFYADKNAIAKIRQTGFIWRYSRSKKRLMKKGKESGNTQKVISLSLDCDNDALLIRVIPKGPACHKGKISCFDENNAVDFAVLSELTQIIRKRRQRPCKGSYTSSIVRNKRAIISKLREECKELIEAKTRKNTVWEAADLLYFMLVYLEYNNINFSEVLKELRRRRSKHK